MKYWDRALGDLETGNKTFQAIYEIVFSFENNIFYETGDGSSIKRTTYKECRNSIKTMASNLKLNLSEHKKKSFVAIKMENSGEWIISFWAILMAGFTPLLINTKTDDSINESLMNSAKISALISNEPFKHFKYFHPDNLLKVCRPIEPDWADQIVLCTSGTSGSPKMCVFDGASICSQILNSRHILKINPTIKHNKKGEAVVLAFLPFYHIFGLVSNLMWFSFFGRTLVFLKDYTPDTILNTCKKHGVTHLFAIPLLWNSVASNVKKKLKNMGDEYIEKLEKGLRLSIFLQTIFPVFGRKFVSRFFFKKVRNNLFGESLTFCISGGSFISEETLRIINGLGYPLYNGYGMTEIGIASANFSLKAKERISGSIGNPFPSHEFKIENKQLFARGKSLFSSYIDDGKLTFYDNDWFSTGDSAYYDVNGNIHIDGRLDDLIINSNGENICPDRLEVLFDLESVNELCILGIKGTNELYDITLVIEPPKNISNLQIKKILLKINEINSSLRIDQKVRRCFISWEPLPSVMGSKVQRKKLQLQIENSAFAGEEILLRDYTENDRLISEEETVVMEFVKKAIAEVLEINILEINDYSHFIEDLNGNSLTYFALISILEQEFGVSFNLSKETICLNPADFTNYILKT